MRKRFVILVTLAFAFWAMASVASAQVERSDVSLDGSEYYFTLDGLDGGVADRCGGEYSGTASAGEVGVSLYLNPDKKLNMHGSIQPNYDDGRPDLDVTSARRGSPICVRGEQVYTVVSRSSGSSGLTIPGMTNMMIGMRFDELCNQGDDALCQWSSAFAEGRLDTISFDSIADLRGLSQTEKDAVGTRFPGDIGRRMKYLVLSPLFSNPSMGRYDDLIQSRHQIWTDTGNPSTEDIITITQYVYSPNNKPYFDVTWEIQPLNLDFEDVTFWVAADTFTAGNDFGYGYLCNLQYDNETDGTTDDDWNSATISGGTGGSSFFQGMIGLHPSAKQFEGWWAAVFELIRKNAFPTFDASNPLKPVLMDSDSNSVFELEPSVALTTLDDNGIAHEWNELTLSADKPTFISMRWTFDDPIQRSSYGTTRSLFVVSSDDKSVANLADSNLTDRIEPMVFDINFDPNHWRGNVNGFHMPKPCNSNEECKLGDLALSCLDSPECEDQAGCPKYCAMGYCDANGDCSDANNNCVFNFCTPGTKWYADGRGEDWQTEKMTSDQWQDRVLFTYDTDGTFYRINSSFKSHFARALHDAGVAGFEGDVSNVSDPLYDSMLERAEDVLDWTLGSLNYATEEGKQADTRKVVHSNESHDFDLHNPLNLDALQNDPRSFIVMLRERYDNDDLSNRWLLGDIAHADPVYLGATPVNSWADVGPSPTYSEWVSDKDSGYMDRAPVLLVAANDGILHCFDAMTGQEVWGFVPWDGLPNLMELSKPFYEQVRSPTMDLKPVVHDAYDSVGGKGWRSVLMVGSRGGGTHYWAMDITPKNGHLAPSNPDEAASWVGHLDFMWYFTDDDLGLTYSVPTSGRFRYCSGCSFNDDVDSRWLTFIGSGYAENSAEQMNKQGYFYALDMFDVEPSGVRKNQPKMVSKVRISSQENNLLGLDASNGEEFLLGNVMTSATVADAWGWGEDASTNFPVQAGESVEQDGYEDTIYIGDLVGNLIRFRVKPAIYGADPEENTNIVGQVIFKTWQSPKSSSESYTLSEYKQTVLNPRLIAASAASGSDLDDQTYDFYKYPRPITARPVVWRTEKTGANRTDFMGNTDNLGQIMVMFGSGKYDAFYDSFDAFLHNPNDPNCATVEQNIGYSSACVRDYQQMFAVVDHQEESGAGSVVPWSDLIENQVTDEQLSAGDVDSETAGSGAEIWVRSVTPVVDPETRSDRRGWYITFNSRNADGSEITQNRGEKVITEPAVVEQENLFRSTSETAQREWVAFFTTFTPNMQGTCDIRAVDDPNAGGGFLMTVSAEWGGNPSFAVQDVTGNQRLTSKDTTSGQGYAGRKYSGSILSKVMVDPYSKAVYVKTGPEDAVMRIQTAGLPYLHEAKTMFYRVVR